MAISPATKMQQQTGLYMGKSTIPRRRHLQPEFHNANTPCHQYHFQAITGLLGTVFADELVAAYPEAKVTVNQQPDIDAWYQGNRHAMVPIRYG
ncbi:uncharacterized protein K452DRAFT_303055 [Aplosporella prunicola CBS 121167]|uniref:Uncharacterized protein n=1 Tax=Aplosporella prunicola CBS 121167 TaxID=1176127 RepID=A0A6A6AWU5_9PEZI|nr:uncharacterized protein K452DRAFT_303055 [Aplosporella prunicola CBS 121167]KAF2136076.1 hypothetical protein K452DRAFT_303055 [Aplosporella prunicola CBS 121167]